jgi:hypothetical protein
VRERERERKREKMKERERVNERAMTIFSYSNFFSITHFLLMPAKHQTLQRRKKIK